MPVVKIRREEIELVKEAAERKAYRTNSTFVVREERIQISNEKTAKSTQDSGSVKTQSR
jgi:hypothetical protein